MTLLIEQNLKRAAVAAAEARGVERARSAIDDRLGNRDYVGVEFPFTFAPNSARADFDGGIDGPLTQIWLK